MLTLAGLVSLEYLLIAVYIVPRLARLADGAGSLIHAATWGAAAFFLGCSVTHLAIAVQTVREPMAMSSEAMLLWHVLPHLAQVAGGAVFIWIGSKRLDIRLAAKEVAARIQEAEQRFRASFERAPIGMALISLQPDSAGVLLQVNPALSAMVGAAPADLQGRTVASLTHPADAALLPEMATVTPRDAADLATEKRYQHRDGREVWVAVQASVVAGPDDQPLYSVAQIRDLTEQRALETRVRQGQKMEAIGSLASGVAHDFNNVLSVIRGASDILLRELDDPDARELVGEIELAAQHATALTTQLLAFGRKQLLKPEPTDINAAVGETLQLVRTLVGPQIVIARDLAPELPLIQVDRNQFAQILLNLSANASDAMPSGGTLTIRTSAATLSAAEATELPDVEPGPYVLLEVQDTGSGLDPSTIDVMFDPFFTTKETGTGLGLATVYGIVKQSGGHLAVASEPGLGATFQIYLPLAERAPLVSAAPHPSDTRDAVGGTLLLVDDSAGVRSVLQRLLTMAGYTVLAASDGANALAVAERHDGPIDLLLTDVVMPRMGGRELVAALRASRPDTKVIFISGYPSDEAIRAEIAAGSVAFLQKPFTNDELLAAIANALG